MSEKHAPTKNASAGRSSSARSLLRLWPYVRPVRTRLLLAAIVAIIASCLGLVFPLVLKWMVDGPVTGREPKGIWLGALWLLLLGIAEAALFGFRRWLVARPLAGVEAGMRADLYRHLQRLPIAFHDRWPSGQLLSRGTTDLMLIRMFLAFPLTFLVVNAATIFTGFVILLLQDWSLGLVLLAPVVPLMILLSLFETRYALVARKAQDQVGDLTTVIEEGVLGIRIIKGFGRHRSQSLAFHELARKLRATELVKARLLAGIWGVIMSIPEIAIGATLVLGTIQVADGHLSAGTLVAFLSTALALRWPVESIGFLVAMSQESATATERFFDVMDVAEEAEPAGTDAMPTEGEDGLRFEAVSFRYPDADPAAPPVLDGIDLHIRPGETMAIVGATGSGKTTLTALVPRLHDVTSGRITLDGADIATMPRHLLRELVSVAFEEPTLFSASVAENVTHGSRGRRRGHPAARSRRGTGPVRPGPPAQHRNPGRRAGPQPLRRPATATGAGPGGGRPTALPGTRRPALRTRRAHRGAGGGGAAQGPAGDHRTRGGSPSFDRDARRPGGAALAGPDHRRRHPPGTAARQRGVRLADVRCGYRRRVPARCQRR